MKTCRKCGVEKPEEDFTPSQLKRNFPCCRGCRREYARNYYSQRPGVKDRIKERGREYRQHPVVNERRREWQKEYQQRPEVKEQRNEYARKRRHSEKDTEAFFQSLAMAEAVKDIGK